MRLSYGAATDIGRVRERNEDSYVADADLGVFAVVDGMGGHVGGEIASQTVAQGLLEFIRETAVDPEKTWPPGFDPTLSNPANRLQVAIRNANRRLSDLVESDQSLNGTGATISAVLFAGDRLAVSNVGDCRAYLIRGADVCQITRDHSLVEEQISAGLLDRDQAQNHPLRHVLTRAVSGESGIDVDTFELHVTAGDRILLCSDGIHGLLTDSEIRVLATASGPVLADACRALIDAANGKGGRDNATVVLIEVRDMNRSGTFIPAE